MGRHVVWALGTGSCQCLLLRVIRKALTHDGIEPLPWVLQLARFCQEHRSYPLEHQSPLSFLISASRALRARIIQLTVLVQAQSTARVLNEKVQKADLVIPNFGK